MTILSALQSAAIRLMGQRPPAFFGSAGKFEMELCDLANEVAADILAYHEWQALVRIASINGNGTTSEYALPSDYDRMLQSAQVSDLKSWAWGYGYYADINAFIQDKERGWGVHPGGWIIYDNKIRFAPAPQAGSKASYPYISKNYARAKNNAPKAQFTADDDTFLLPERLLTLGLVWRWREQKKLDASGDQEAFIKALDEVAGKDKGARIIRSKASSSFPGAHLAWPGELGPNMPWNH